MKNIIMKLNVLLALTDSLAGPFKRMVEDYTKFFKGKQTAFLGGRKTYTPKPDTIDEPNKRGSARVITTVTEKFDFFIESTEKYITSLFSQEKSNASGSAIADLVVDGVTWGSYTSLELLRLKSVVGASSIEQMLTSIPVRSDAEEWNSSMDDMHAGRGGIYETPIVVGVNITTTKEDYILPDPNIGNSAGARYVPQVAQKTTIVELGDTSSQKFSGEWSQRERATALRRRTNLLSAITQALKECNEVEIVESNLTSNKIFGYIFYGS